MSETENKTLLNWSRNWNVSKEYATDNSTFSSYSLVNSVLSVILLGPKT